jgi:flagellar biosynthetic protein FlhB
MASHDKSEKPSHKRIEKARKEGNFPNTRLFLAGCQFLVFVAVLQNLGGKWIASCRIVSAAVLRRAFSGNLLVEDWLVIARDVVYYLLAPLVITGIGMALLSFALQLGLTKMGFSFTKVTPDFKRLSPISKLKNIANQNLPAFLQSLLLLPICAYAIYAIVAENKDRLMILPFKSLEAGTVDVVSTMLSLLWRGATVFFVFGCIELIREKRRHMNQLKMTKQEVKDEHKENEGNPEVKARIRSIRRSQARKRMMSEVPKATAVIVNPTHYAVALRYDPETMAAPLVVAKGKNYIALRIRKLALEHQVPLVENRPLAQGLYKAAEVGHEIPPHLYRAVAEVLAYILRVMNRR